MKQLITLALITTIVAILGVSPVHAQDEYECTTSGAYGQNETCVLKTTETKEIIRTHDITAVETSLTRQQWYLVASVILAGLAASYVLKLRYSQNN